MKSIVKFVFSSCLSICALGFAVTSFAQTSDTLKNLYQQVSKEVSAEAAHNSEREQRFRAAAT
jgi:biopolymer transport protein ExbB